MRASASRKWLYSHPHWGDSRASGNTVIGPRRPGNGLPADWKRFQMAPNALASRARDPMGRDGSGCPRRRAPSQRPDPSGPDAAPPGRQGRKDLLAMADGLPSGRPDVTRPQGPPGPARDLDRIFIRSEAWDPAEDRRSSGGDGPHGPSPDPPPTPAPVRPAREEYDLRLFLRAKILLATRGKQPPRKRRLADTGFPDAALAAAERDHAQSPETAWGASARLARRTDVARPRSAGRGGRTGSNRQSCQGPSGPQGCHPLAWHPSSPIARSGMRNQRIDGACAPRPLASSAFA